MSERVAIIDHKAGWITSTGYGEGIAGVAGVANPIGAISVVAGEKHV